ncbi:MAG TPA: hypothetical protein V6C97_31385 [Oculatellaceae cyanobacterium]
MKRRHIESTLMVASLTIVIGILAACSQNRNTAMNQLPPQAGSMDLSTNDGRIVVDPRQLAQPLDEPIPKDANGIPYYYNDTPYPRRTTNDRAPLVDLHIDRRSGAVHLNTPFVRVDTGGHGRGAVVNVPPLRQDYADNSYPTPTSQQ